MENDGFNRLVLARRPRLARGGACCAPTATTCARSVSPSARATCAGAGPQPAARPPARRAVPRPLRPGAGGAACGRASRRRTPSFREALDAVKSSTRTASCAASSTWSRRRCAPTTSSAAATASPSPTCRSSSTPRRSRSLPLPRPLCEIFVYSPRVEAVHLRGGKVARGGIRWSDRRGGLPHRGPRPDEGADGEERRHRARSAPRAASSSSARRPQAGARRSQARGGRVLQDHDARPARPHRQPARRRGRAAARRGAPRRRRPYLVVAADKGTATFSDIANGVSAEYGFWLGDAFASGGSAGYDHKEMGITARGAWESVKRHFRELGTDIQGEPTSPSSASATCRATSSATACCCPSSIRLVGAFNHLHIFIDPDPDPAESFARAPAPLRAAALVLGATTTPRCSRPAAASSSAAPSRSRWRRAPALASASRRRASRPRS